MSSQKQNKNVNVGGEDGMSEMTIIMGQLIFKVQDPYMIVVPQ